MGRFLNSALLSIMLIMIPHLMINAEAQDIRFPDGFLQTLPEEISSWKLSGAHELFTTENLYDYIDGGAELYISFGFRELLSVTYESRQAPAIRLDIFDMGESRNAFGLFTHSRETLEDDFGQGSQFFTGLLLFWKDRYFVSLLCSPETETSRTAVRDLGRQIESVITNEGDVPVLVNQLPPDQLDAASIKYFRHPVWLNTYYYISDENLLQIDQQTDCVLARYEHGIALVVAYIDDASARSAFGKFSRKYFLKDGYAGDPVQLPDGKWGISRITGSCVIAVFDAPDRNNALKLINDLEKMYKPFGRPE